MLASRQLQKGLEHVTKNRELSRKDFRELCDLRIEAGAKDLHYDPFYMRHFGQTPYWTQYKSFGKFG